MASTYHTYRIISPYCYIRFKFYTQNMSKNCWCIHIYIYMPWRNGQLFLFLHSSARWFRDVWSNVSNTYVKHSPFNRLWALCTLVRCSWVEQELRDTQASKVRFMDPAKQCDLGIFGGWTRITRSEMVPGFEARTNMDKAPLMGGKKQWNILKQWTKKKWKATTKCGPRRIARLLKMTPITMVYGLRLAYNGGPTL